MKPGKSFSYHTLLAEDMAPIKHIVIIYAFVSSGLYVGQRIAISDVTPGASDTAILRQKTQVELGLILWTSCSQGFHVDCS